VGITQI
jgi:hypothetical protein